MTVAELFDTPVNATKMVMSVAVLIGAMGVIFYGVGNGLALLPGPISLHFILLFGAVTLLAYLEGLQVAILALENLDYTVYREQYPSGAKVMDRATRPDAVKKFLCGRQFFVVFVVFLVAQLTTFPDFPSGGMPEWLFILVIDTGLSGALFVLMFGQLLPQITAADYPLQFCGLPGSMSVLYLCLGFEFLGVTDVSWLMAAGLAKLTHAEPKAFIQRQRNTDGTWKDSADQSSTSDSGEIEENDEVEHYSQISWDEIFQVANKNVTKQVGPSKVGYTDLSRSSLPSREEMRLSLVKEGKPVPRYLLPETHPMYIPPHLVAAVELLKMGNQLDQLTPVHFKTASRSVGIGA